MTTEETDKNSVVLTISELIDAAFGDPDKNVVHHKHIQTILYLLARQLKILERRVAVKIAPYEIEIQKSSSSLSVTEVKLQAMTETKKREIKSTASPKTGYIAAPQTQQTQQKGKGTTIDETSGVKASSGKQASHRESADKAPAGKQDTDKNTYKDKSFTAGKSPITDDTSIEDTASSADKKTTSGKSSAEVAAADRKSPTDHTSSTGKKSTNDQSLAAEDTSPPDQTLAGEDISAVDKSLSAKNKSTAGQTSAADTRASAKKSTADRTAVDTPSSVTKKSNVGQTSAAEVILSDDKKSSTVRKPTTGQTSSADKASTAKKSKKSAASPDTKSTDPQIYHSLLDKVEETRERELRVIRQRLDSHDESDKTPTPIASLDSVEATYEKLLVVERVPAEEAKDRAAQGRKTVGPEPRISVVTLKQFHELANRVQNLQKKLAPIGSSNFPENKELMEELRKTASLTDAMAALQLSARLEATEKTLTNLLSLVTDLAMKTPGINVTRGGTDNIEILFGASKQKEEKGAAGGGRSGAGGGGVRGGGVVLVGEERGRARAEAEAEAKRKSTLASLSKGPDHLSKETEVFIPALTAASKTMSSAAASRYDVDIPDIEDPMKPRDTVTYQELEKLLDNVYETIMKQVTETSNEYTVNAQKALNLVNNLEKKIDLSLNLGNRMENLELLVANYSTQINILDTGFSSQLTNYQEELTQMQHDLETGLENMAEVLANMGGDATAVAELNAHFNNLQEDIDEAVRKQKDLKKIQLRFSADLDGLRAQIEILRAEKSDRDEVVDALRDKAGIKDLNGLISHQQFDAVRGDFEKRIANAYDKFNNQETIWQKAIDDLLRELNEKADMIQVESLRDEINYYLELLRKKMQFITDIVGEPAAAALSRKLGRDAACLSCAAPAFMKTEELTTPMLPALRPPTIGAERPKPQEDGDHGLCYQGHPVRHPIDPRAHVCNRWCGGSHTLVNAPISRSPPAVTITPFNRKVGQARGTDRKMYAVDEEVAKKPCPQCKVLVPESPVASDGDVEQTEEEPVVPYDWPPISSVIERLL